MLSNSRGAGTILVYEYQRNSAFRALLADIIEVLHQLWDTEIL